MRSVLLVSRTELSVKALDFSSPRCSRLSSWWMTKCLSSKLRAAFATTWLQSNDVVAINGALARETQWISFVESKGAFLTQG